MLCLPFRVTVSCQIVLIMFAVNTGAITRKLSHHVFTDCDSSNDWTLSNNETYLNLVHVIADGPNDTIHYLWTSYKLPTVIIAKTSLNVSLKFDCEQLMMLQNGSISFSEHPLLSTAFTITKLWEFVDVKDTVNMEKASKIIPHDISLLQWSNISANIQVSENMISSIVEGRNNESIFSSDGVFKIRFSVSATEEASNTFPHLHFNGNSTEVTIQLNNLNPKNGSARFAVELEALSSPFSDHQWQSSAVYSLDDEYSPGVFKVQNLFSPCPSTGEDCKSFLSWKPVAYLGEEPTVANSSDAALSANIEQKISMSPSIATVYFSNSSVSPMACNVTFGTSGDGFYKQTKYTSWSLMIGAGEPLFDKMSVLVIVFISLGLGMPLLIMLVGGSYLGFRRFQRKNDDLLLEG